MKSVRIPADIDQPDRLLGGMTARQLGVISVTAVLCWLMFNVASVALPTLAALPLAIPLVLVGSFCAFGQRDGLRGDRLVLAMWQYWRKPRRSIFAPDGVAPVPQWVSTREASPAAMEFPASDVDVNGVMDLDGDGAAVICRVSSLNFALRSEREQEALIAGFGRLLNGISQPVQIVVRSERTDVSHIVNELRVTAVELPHPALESAANEHAEFLVSLAQRRDVVFRDVLVVLREHSDIDVATPILSRRFKELSTALSAIGITSTILDGNATAAMLRRIAGPKDHDDVAKHIDGPSTFEEQR